ncbi:MAG: M20/M25/M40 family metallo-hydrolase [Chitinophagaceae bacterium]
MKRLILLGFAFYIQTSIFAQTAQQDSLVLKSISNYILSNYTCYSDLHYLCKQIGHRISGSKQAEMAVEWAKKTLEKTGCDRVYLQEVMVPHWVRGKEKGEIRLPNKKNIPITISSLGNAVGTPEQGLAANILQINHIDELKKLSKKDVEGKIVFYNFRFDQTNIHTFESYGPCVYYRWGAPSEAAKLGAIGVVIRSVSSAYDDKPHTGSLTYNKDYPAIPAVAISNLDADLLEKTIAQEKNVQFFILSTCKMMEDVKSYNVIAELKGSEHEDEYIDFGGHLDSWDIGEGAHDDGAGVVQAIEVIRVFKSLGIRPKRTLRAVLFMNEENGLKGAKAYAEIAKANNEKHILAIESDAGGATPHGFSMTMSNEQRAKISAWSFLLRPYGLYTFEKEGGGADVSQLNKQMDTPVMELMPDSQRYFDMHHSANDIFENVHRRELCLGAIAIAQMVYLVDMYGL